MDEREKQKGNLPGEHSSDSTSNASPQEAASKGQYEEGRGEARERILSAAQSLFAAHGFSASTTKAIAQRAEVPIGLVFYYFSSKKVLLECVINEHNMLTELRGVVETLDMADPRSALIALGSQY